MAAGLKIIMREKNHGRMTKAVQVPQNHSYYEGDQDAFVCFGIVSSTTSHGGSM